MHRSKNTDRRAKVFARIGGLQIEFGSVEHSSAQIGEHRSALNSIFTDRRASVGARAIERRPQATGRHTGLEFGVRLRQEGPHSS